MEEITAPQIGPSEADPEQPTDSFEFSAAALSSDSKKKKEKLKCIPGFIFMCNQQSKLDCFQYRVFGLPLSKEKIVKEIKPGAKLFLYDFDVKLLYGVYQATCVGRLNLEPDAFNGKYPAQVKFSIFKECLPLQESSMRQLIKENYVGSKFNQELSLKHVRKLLTSFRPLTSLSSSLPSQDHALAHTQQPYAHSYPYAHAHAHALVQAHGQAHVERPNSYIPPMPDFHRASNLNYNYFQPGYPGENTIYLQHASPNVGLRSLMPSSSYHPSVQSYQTDGAQEKAYLSYATTEVAALESQYHPAPLYQDSTKREIITQQQQDQATALENQYIPVSVNSVPPYQDNSAAPTTTPQVSVYYYPSTAQDQYTVPPPAYGITQAAADASHYASSEATHYSAHYTPDASQYAGSQPQPYQVTAEYYHQIPSQDQAAAAHQENGTTYYYYYYPSAAPADGSSAASVSQAP